MRIAFVFALLACLAVALPGQDLDSTYVSDEFNAGSRGNDIGSGTYGASATDPASGEWLEITDTNGAHGTIRYINSWAGASNPPSEIESPIVNVTTSYDNPDRPGNTIEAIPANALDTASPNNAVLIGNDGGYNGLFFGQGDDSDYFVQVDVFCEDRTSEGLSVYEAVSLAFRASPEPIYEYSFNMDRDGSYSLTYDAQLGSVSARKWTQGNGSGDAASRLPSAFTEFASQPLAEGWHTFRIEGLGALIRFYVDGTLLTSVVDSEFPNGLPGLIYREAAIASADESQGKFDRLRAGPTPPLEVTGVSHFELYR